MNAAEVLKKTFLFKDMGAAELKKLAAIAKQDQISQGTQLFSEGEHGDALFVIVMGSVKVVKRDKNNEEEVATLGTGSYFGEMALLDDNHERSATIVAKEPTHLLTFARADIKALCDRDDAFGHQFYAGLARGMVRRLRATTVDAAFYRSLAKQRHN